MLNDSAQQQLLALDLRKILGPEEGDDKEFDDGLQDLVNVAWANFLDEEVASLLTDEQMQQLADVFKKEDVKPEDVIAVLRAALPDFDRQFQQKVLEVKEGVVRGRVDGLMEEAVNDEQKKAALQEIVSLMDQGQWTQAEEKLAAFQ